MLFLGGLLLSQFAIGQYDFAVISHQDLPQSKVFLPQNQIEDAKLYLALPSVAFHVGNSGFSYNDLVKSDADSSFLDFNAMITGLAKQNYLAAHADITYLEVGITHRQFQFSLKASQSLRLNSRYSRDMVGFLWYGNAKFVGRKVNLAPDLRALNYSQLEFNISQKLKKWQYGVALKYLSGHSALVAEANKLEVYTDPEDFGLSLNSDLIIHTTKPLEMTQIHPFPVIEFKNPGFGFDAGVSFLPNQYWTIYSSMTDFGFIHWSSDPSNYRVNGNLQFDGIGLSDFILGDSILLSQFEDSVYKFIAVDSTSLKFKSNLIPRYTFGLERTFKERWSLNTLISTQTLSGGATLVFSTGLSKTWHLKGQDLKTGIHYTYRNRSPYGVGLSGQWRWKWLVCYFGGDNLFAWFLPKAKVPLSLFDQNNADFIIIPKHMRTMNFRFAINVIIPAQGNNHGSGSNQNL